MPDILTLSKALTGGTLPLAATHRAPQGVRRVLVGRSGARADARARPSWRTRLPAPPPMPRSICSSASRGSNKWRAISAALQHGLEPCRELPGVKDVRVKGAIGVVELERIENLNVLRQRFIAEGVFVRPFGSVVYLTPAFTIGEDDLAALMKAIRSVLGEGRSPAKCSDQDCLAEYRGQVLQ